MEGAARGSAPERMGHDYFETPWGAVRDEGGMRNNRPVATRKTGHSKNAGLILQAMTWPRRSRVASGTLVDTLGHLLNSPRRHSQARQLKLEGLLVNRR